jgi:oxygen-dependent protoporphyrinogen oxidase
MTTQATKHSQVIVVGGGIAGLTAAHILKRHGMINQVIEATSRVGGRMTSDVVDGHVVDRGAQFLSTGYAVIPGLLEELCISRRVRRTSPFSATVRGGKARVVRTGSVTEPFTSGLLSLHAWIKLGWKTLPLTFRLQHHSLSDYSQWAAFDTESTATWSDRDIAAEVTEYVYEPMLQGFYFQSPEETSKALAFALTAFGMRRAKILSLEGGLGSLPEEIARELDITLDTVVRSVDVRDGRVRVETSAGALTADRVILAVPAPVARVIMAGPVDDLTGRLLDTPYSPSINVACITDADFRLPDGLEAIYGILIPRRERLCVAAIGIENNKNRGSAIGSHLLNIMFASEPASRLMSTSDSEIVETAVRSAASLLPSLTQHLVDSRVYRWPMAEPRSMVGRASDLARYRARCITAPPPVILAGDYMSMPYTDGAAESGAWAARLIAAASTPTSQRARRLSAVRP